VVIKIIAKAKPPSQEGVRDVSTTNQPLLTPHFMAAKCPST